MTPPATIVPRWEWRTFADGFGQAEAHILAHAAAPRSSAEIYVLCQGSDVNVKIRDGVLDVKRLLRAERGLELWSPVLKAAFPIDPDAVAAVLAAWAIERPVTARRAFDLDAFLSEIVAPAASLRAVRVEKTRHGAVLDGCTVEVAELRVDGRPIRTIGVEAEDADVVLRTVDALGLAACRNLNYVTALKALTGFGAIAAYDRAPGGRLS